MNSLCFPLMPLHAPLRQNDPRQLSMWSSSLLAPLFANVFYSFSLAGYGYSVSMLLLPELLFSINVTKHPNLHKLQTVLHQCFSTTLFCTHAYLNLATPSSWGITSTLVMGLYMLATDCHGYLLRRSSTKPEVGVSNTLRFLRHGLISLLYLNAPAPTTPWQVFFFRTQVFASMTTVAVVPLQEVLRPAGKKVVKILREKRRRRTSIRR